MSKYNILLVDDSPKILKALQRVFQTMQDYLVFTALSAKAALAVMESEKIDLLITDERMPETSGTELLSTVRVLYPEIVRIMLTGQTDMDVAKNAINKGEIYRFFTKPWDDFELLIAVRHALKHKDLEQENIKLKSRVNHQEEFLVQLEREHPGISETKLADDGSIIIDSED